MDKSSNNKPTFYYFPGNAKGGVIRAILHSQNVDFENKKLTFEDWAPVKQSGKFEFGQMPAYEENGKIYTQSIAIQQFLGEKYNLFGSNAEEKYEISSLLLSYDDFFPKFRPVCLPMSDEEKKNVDKNTTEFLSDSAVKFLKIYENRVAKSNGNYVVGNKFSLADIYLSFFVYYVFRHGSRKDKFEPVLQQNAPKLAKLAERVHDNELKSYFEKGYVTEVDF